MGFSLGGKRGWVKLEKTRRLLWLGGRSDRKEKWEDDIEAACVARLPHLDRAGTKAGGGLKDLMKNKLKKFVIQGGRGGGSKKPRRGVTRHTLKKIR